MIRPQFGSPPNHAHFVSVELATASAARRASVSVAAPLTWTSTNFVTPSPSSTIMRASCLVT